MRNLLAFGLFTIVCAILIGVLFVVNDWLPLNFTGYFLLCAISIIVCIALLFRANFRKSTLIIPWLITTVASFIITINYLSPKDARIYSNADTNVLALKGVDVKDSIILIGKDKLCSFYDNSDYEGTLVVMNSPTVDSVCEVHYNVLDLPVFINSPRLKKDSLLNASFLPSFNNTLSFSVDDSLKCSINFSEVNETKWFTNYHLREKIDSMLVTIAFESANDTTKYYSAFTKRIKHSYNLYDIVHNSLSFKAQEEEIIDKLKNIVLIRNIRAKEGLNTSKEFFITYDRELQECALSCDGVLFTPNYTGGKHILSSNEYLYVGMYDSNTRPINFSSGEDGMLRVRYKFPYLNNFPRTSLEKDYHDGMRKVLAISSSTDRLLQSDVKEAFYYDLFENDNNNFRFSGSINYKVSNCNTPFNANIIDDETTESREENTLLARNKSIWHFAVYDLRKQSPVTGKNNPFTSNSFIITIVAILCLFAFLITQLFYKSSAKAGIVFGVWLFFIPLIVFRLYLLWRIAVFPPVTDITYNVFQRYRMENGWSDNAMIITLISITFLIIFTILSILLEKVVVLKSEWGSKPLYKSFNRYKALFCGCWTVSLILIPTGVLGNIAAPVVFFVVCEFVSLKGLNYKWRVANVLLAFLLFCVGDPGYAIMFFIFACVYFIIQLYAYLKSTPGILASKAIAYIIWLSLFTALGLIIIFSPQIVTFAYDDVTEVFFPFLTPSKIIFTIIAFLLCAFLFLFFWVKDKKTFALSSLVAIPVVTIILVFAGNYILEKEPHFKYRSLVHTETVSDIMAREDIDNRNSTRLLEASQNQWFIQYHNNRGDKRVFESGLYSLSPHFKKGVSWNTQISDVIISRYVVGEISSVLPGAIVLFALCFLLLIFRSKNNSVAGKSVSFAVALLILIQMTFVWMAATNRMIFFGQDFPLLSQNARITMFMFIILLGIVMILASPIKVDSESAIHLSTGLNNFAKNKKSVFISVYIIVFAFVGFWGNKYASIYKDEDGGDSGNASEYNLARMMNRCQADLSLINEQLSESSIPTHKLENEKSVATLMDSLDVDVKLTEFVKDKRNNNEISKFTLSMYNAFRKNLQRRNSISNIIHLKQNASQTHYELALNNGFYSLKNPESETAAWKDNVYSENVSHSSDKIYVSKRNGLTIYGVPQSWLPKGCQVGVVDATDINKTTIHQIRTLHSEQADYNAIMPIYPIKSGDVLEIYSKNTKITESFRYGISEENVLVKNMVINGKRKHFYPLKEKCFWLKDFSEMISYCMDSKTDSVIITLDKDLTLKVYDELVGTGKICSVIAMDGMGNVRLMADFRGKRYMLDPNDEEDINEKVAYHYLNPSPKEESNLFGNMNLCLLNPGPGSSLKPITYAAVTSQTSDFPWENLKLMSADPKYYANDSSIIYLDWVMKNGKKVPSHTNLRKYGPSYNYRRPFKSLYGDETGDGIWVDNLFYLSQSSNYYNALVTYLGHYGSLSSEPWASTLFREANDTDYPKFIFSTGGIKYTFKVSPENIVNKESSTILLRGLYNNFSMPTHRLYADSLRHIFVGTQLGEKKNVPNKKLATLFPWVYPQASSILEYKLNEHTAAERLRQYTLGSYPIAVTPLKMAEMYGKLYSLHPDFHASIVPNAQPFEEIWRNSDGEKESGIYSFYQHNLYRGMRLCVEQGTAKVLKKLSLDTKYYYYAKTGTLLGQNAEHDDRMLAVIISNKDMEQINSPEEARFFVVYFRYKESGTMPGVYSIVKDIVESESFSYYMSK